MKGIETEAQGPGGNARHRIRRETAAQGPARLNLRLHGAQLGTLHQRGLLFFELGDLGIKLLFGDLRLRHAGKARSECYCDH